MTPFEVLLQSLIVERFTHLPESPPLRPDGPTACWAEVTEAAAWARLHELREVS